MSQSFDQILMFAGRPDSDTKIDALLREHSMRSFLEDKKELADSVRQIVADVGRQSADSVRCTRIAPTPYSSRPVVGWSSARSRTAL